MLSKACIALIFIITFFKATASPITLIARNAVVWHPLQSIRIAHATPALRSKHMQALPVKPESIFALHRWYNNENIIVLSNLTSKDSNTEIDIHLLSNTPAKYIDLITQEVFVTNSNVTSLNVQMNKHSTRLLLGVK